MKAVHWNVRRVLICRCKVCNGATFIALYDTPDETASANKHMKKLEKQDRNPQIEEFPSDAHMPTWCKGHKEN